MNKIRTQLNLSSTTRYLNFNVFPKQLNNNFKEEIISQLSINFELKHTIIDYYYDDTHIYLYTNNDMVLVFDMTTEKIIFEQQVSHYKDDDTSANESIQIRKNLIYNDGHLYLLSTNGLYYLSKDHAERINSFSTQNTQPFIHDSNVFLLHQVTSVSYEIHEFEESAISHLATINKNNLQFNKLEVISDNLFIQRNSQ